MPRTANEAILFDALQQAIENAVEAGVKPERITDLLMILAGEKPLD